MLLVFHSLPLFSAFCEQHQFKMIELIVGMDSKVSYKIRLVLERLKVFIQVTIVYLLFRPFGRVVVVVYVVVIVAVLLICPGTNELVLLLVVVVVAVPGGTRSMSSDSS